MVVVEGVARSLDPNINIWSVARPVVEDYITRNIGPKALVSDLWRTARVLARFGPRLPQLAEAALIAQTQPAPPAPRKWRERAIWLVLGAVLGAALIVLGTLI